MKRLGIVILNLFLIVAGFLIVYYRPLDFLAITLGWILISISIISFAVLIYFPPPKQRYVKLRVIEETAKIPETSQKTKKAKKKPKKRKKKKKRAQYYCNKCKRNHFKSSKIGKKHKKFKRKRRKR